MQIEITHFIIHILIYFAFGFLLVNLLSKSKVVAEMHAEITKIRTNVLSLESTIRTLTNSINNKLMTDESKARTTCMEMKDKIDMTNKS